jgi:tetratricopeptide (TPR) repeat protein
MVKVRLALIFLVVFVFSSFSVVYAQEPDTEKLYREGMYLKEKGDLYSAIEAFNSILSSQPALHRVRLELAVAYYRAMNFEESKRQAEMVLQDPKIPESVRLSILAFLAQVKKDEEAMVTKRHVFEPSVSFGLLYDSNVNAGPSDNLIQLGDLTLTLTTESLKQSDWAAFLSAGLTHRYQFPNSLKIGEKVGRFIWISEANAYRKQYFKEEDFNLDVLSLSTGPSLLVLQAWRASLLGRVDYIRLSDEDLAWYLSLTPTVSWQYKNSELTWDALLLKRDFIQEEDAGRDSSYMSTGLYYGHLFKDGKYAVQVGGRVFKDDADLIRFSNDGTELLIGANMVAWANGSVYAKATQKDIEYEGREPVFSRARDERERRYEVGFSHLFKETLLKEWKLNGSFEYTENESNVPIYDFTRNVTAVSLSRTF